MCIACLEVLQLQCIMPAMLAPSRQHVTAYLPEPALHVQQGSRHNRFMPCTCVHVNPACVLPGDLLT
jgi:hypothetical protein